MSSINAYTTNEGKRYRVLYRYPDGRQSSKRGFKTKSEAQAYLYKLESDKQKGRIVTESAGRQLVKDLAAEWIQSKINLKPSSLERNKVTIKNHINPYLGDYQIKNLSHQDIQKWTNLLNRTLSSSTVRKAHQCLSQMLDTAVLHNRLNKNPANKITLPRIKKKEPVYLTISQLKELALAAGEYQDVIIFLGLTGLRFGEMAALKTKNWNSQKRKLTISENVTELNGKLTWGTPKNGKSRTIITPNTITNILDKYTPHKDGDELIFTSGNSEVLRVNNFSHRHFEKAVKLSNIPRITLHDLRHTAASIAISSGANVKVVQQMLGHASAAMTLDIYGGLFEEDMATDADAIEKQFL